MFILCRFVCIYNRTIPSFLRKLLLFPSCFFITLPLQLNPFFSPFLRLQGCLRFAIEALSSSFPVLAFPPIFQALSSTHFSFSTKLI
ncbi:hypothetical protein SLE2022_234870 [Rubroshorea leprosula]